MGGIGRVVLSAPDGSRDRERRQAYLYRFFPAPGERSIRIVTTSTPTCQGSHAPPYQLCTTEYQRSVTGAKRKPRTGQSRVLKTPWNQLLKNQTAAITRRGTASATSASRQGMGGGGGSWRGLHDPDVDPALHEITLYERGGQPGTAPPDTLPTRERARSCDYRCALRGHRRAEAALQVLPEILHILQPHGEAEHPLTDPALRTRLIASHAVGETGRVLDERVHRAE